jgi:hypothetical protein
MSGSGLNVHRLVRLRLGSVPRLGELQARASLSATPCPWIPEKLADGVDGSMVKHVVWKKLD